MHDTGLRKCCQLCWLHSSLIYTPDPLTHLRCLCLSNHLFCQMKWQQIRRSSQMVLMCFLHFGLLHAFSNRAPHFHVFHYVLCGCSRPPNFYCVYWQTILMEEKKSNKISIVSIMSLCIPRVVIIRFAKKHLPTLTCCVMVWIAEDFVDKFTRNLVRRLFFQPRSILQQLTIFISISSMKLCHLPAYTGYEMN